MTSPELAAKEILETLFGTGDHRYLKSVPVLAEIIERRSGLSELVKACETVMNMWRHANPFTGSGQWEKLEALPRILGNAINREGR